MDARHPGPGRSPDDCGGSTTPLGHRGPGGSGLCGATPIPGTESAGRREGAAHARLLAAGCGDPPPTAPTPERPNLGYRPRYKQGYFPVSPADHYQDIRSEMVTTLEEAGIPYPNADWTWEDLLRACRAITDPLLRFFRI